jgi:hypothetical protein
MSLLTPRKRELVSAMGSKLHFLQRAHLGVEKGWGNRCADLGATRLADPRNVPARRTLDTGLELAPVSTPAVQAHKPCCG